MKYGSAGSRGPSTLFLVARPRFLNTPPGPRPGRPAGDSVVWIDAPNAAGARAPAHAVLDQRNLTFLPHVMAVRAGTVVDFPNHDRVFHNVFSFHDGVLRFDRTS